eukprot:Selendium_serpulae@DN11984_c0_g1_i1.p1
MNLSSRQAMNQITSVTTAEAITAITSTGSGTPPPAVRAAAPPTSKKTVKRVQNSLFPTIRISNSSTTEIGVSPPKAEETRTAPHELDVENEPHVQNEIEFENEIEDENEIELENEIEVENEPDETTIQESRGVE